MNKKIFLFIVSLMSALSSYAQIGVGTTEPSSNNALQVNGNLKLSGELSLEEPGGFTIINGQKFIVRANGGKLYKYNIKKAKYAPVNYVNYILEDVNTNGLKDFNTGIPKDKYVVSLQGYKFLDADENHDPLDATYFINKSYPIGGSYKFGKDKVNGLVARAYIKNKTWWIQFYCNNSKFYRHDYGSINVNLTLHVLIFRKNLLTNSGGPIIVDMNETTTATAAKPTGY